MDNQEKTREVYRAIYHDEIEDFKNPQLLAQKEYMKKEFCEENYTGQNNFNYNTILQENNIDNQDESFIFFFSNKDFAEKYAKNLSNIIRGDAVVCAFQFDEQLLKVCKGFGIYEKTNSTDKILQEEYAVPLSLYNPEKNFIGPTEEQSKYAYDPDNYSFYI